MIQVTGEFNLFAKDEQTRADWSDPRLDSRVRRLVRHLAVELAHLGAPCVLTDIYRDNPKSVHGSWRGADCRISCSMKDAEKLREWFNRVFPYGKGKIETIPPLDHGTGPHFHAQVKQGGSA